MDRRQELEIEYQKYINQLAEFHMQNKTDEVNATLNIILNIESEIRNLNITEAIQEISKQNSASVK